jgi:hypothetical protein
MKWVPNFNGSFNEGVKAVDFTESEIQLMMKFAKEKDLEPTYEDCEHFLTSISCHIIEKKMSFEAFIAWILKYDDLDRIEGCFARYQARHFDGDLIKC